ncbi:hypothetical protein [Lactobacillus corticis]|uniref:Uncharacterized protein n=1 Tax=Lactobacillus corticis TaxID=2201249 RepID=A0A916VIK7_9LACO|nr:hypothetical protein [Lactobacillus corticis]GFZ27403.1 hypothetical protein LCB40_12830 [Lactobacillus corticis]
MLAASKRKFSGFLDRIAAGAKLDAKRLLKTYAYVLMAIPLAFFLLIAVQNAALKRSFSQMLTKSPVSAVGVIIAIVDFILGYYLLLSIDKVMKNRLTYRFFMWTQLISQLLVGNLFCAFFAGLGIHQGKQLEDDGKIPNRTIEAVAIVCSLLLIVCFTLILVISL